MYEIQDLSWRVLQVSDGNRRGSLRSRAKGQPSGNFPVCSKATLFAYSVFVGWLLAENRSGSACGLVSE